MRWNDVIRMAGVAVFVANLGGARLGNAASWPSLLPDDGGDLGVSDTGGEYGSGFCGGMGTESDPFLICNEEQFQLIGQNPSACYKLFQDIYLTSKITPISEFSGIFDGDFKTVFDLEYAGVAGADAGWILVNSGSINSVRFSHSYISGYGMRTGLIARNNGAISFVDVIDGAVNAEEISTYGMMGGVVAVNDGVIEFSGFQGHMLYPNHSAAGGVVGVNRPGAWVYWSYLGRESRIQRSSGGDITFVGGIVGVNAGDIRGTEVFADTVVSGGQSVGGVAGVNTAEAKIFGAAVFGVISSDKPVGFLGGVAGRNRGKIESVGVTASAVVDPMLAAGGAVGGIVGFQGVNAIIEDSFSFATIAASGGGESAGGGLVGHQMGIIRHSYSAVSVKSYTYAGAFCGLKSGRSSTSGSYYYSGSTPSTDTCAEEMSGAQMTSQANYIGGDLDVIWKINPGESPGLQWPYYYPYERGKFFKSSEPREED